MDEILEHVTTRNVLTGDAVMFDIDDTLIDSRTGKVIRHVRSLLDTCKQLGYKIVIITARPGDYHSQQYTEYELARHNIKYDFLGYCEATSKSYLKKYLMENEGWHFVLSVGDLYTDLTDSDIYLLVQG